MAWNMRGWVAIATAWAMMQAGARAMAQEVDRALVVAIIKGQDGTNDIAKGTSDGIVVRVTSAGRPVGDAKVTVIFPASGASLRTADRKPTAVENTDATGMATFAGLRPNDIAGEIDIVAIASADGRAGQVHIRQRNVNPAPVTSTAASQPAPNASSAVAAKPETAAKPSPAAQKPANHGHKTLWIVLGVAIAGGAIGGISMTAKGKK
jgi:hypothetical protein